MYLLEAESVLWHLCEFAVAPQSAIAYSLGTVALTSACYSCVIASFAKLVEKEKDLLVFPGPEFLQHAYLGPGYVQRAFPCQILLLKTMADSLRKDH